MTDTERKEVGIKPCPFCRQELEIVEIRSHHTNESFRLWHGFNIVCPISNTIMGQYFTRDKAIEHANLRWEGRPQDNNALVPLDKESFRPYLISAMADFATAQKTREFCADKSDIMLNHLHIICSKFGKDNSGMVPRAGLLTEDMADQVASTIPYECNTLKVINGEKRDG